MLERTDIHSSLTIHRKRRSAFLRVLIEDSGFPVTEISTAQLFSGATKLPGSIIIFYTARHSNFSLILMH